MKCLGIILFIILCAGGCPEKVLGQDVRCCDSSLRGNKGILRGKASYEFRDNNRCEGFYVDPQNIPPFTLVSLVYEFSDFQDLSVLNLRWPRVDLTDQPPVFIQANSMKDGSFYRMDSFFEGDTDFFNWPIEFLRKYGSEFNNQNLGILAWRGKNHTIKIEERVFIPIAAGTGGQNCGSDVISCHIFCNMEIDKLTAVVRNEKDKEIVSTEKSLRDFSSCGGLISFQLPSCIENSAEVRTLSITGYLAGELVNTKSFLVFFQEKKN